VARLFGDDPEMLAIGTTYLRTVGPFFGFFGLGTTLCFASQGAGRLGWPSIAGLLRVLVTLGGGWLVLHLTGSLAWLFVVYASGLFIYGVVIAATVGSGRWFRRPLLA
jgi:Na+-driven multidrug efflux pump